MAICEICGGKMVKRTSPFGYISWYCGDCGNTDTVFKGFKIPRKMKGGKK